jgi:hypothetical protein
VENQLKVHGKRVETNLVTGNLTSKVIIIFMKQKTLRLCLPCPPY